MSAHSRGPWKPVDGPDDGCPYRVRDTNGSEVGAFWSHEDARLIAKAPELLAALKDVLYSAKPDRETVAYNLIREIEGEG